VRLGASKQLPAGTGALYQDPVDGQADIVVRQPSGALSACSAICTHAGCRVEYTNGELYCPCHGSAFDSRTGAVKQGPATQPLAVKRVVERGGSIYALRA
jgi:thiosulfate dehydrogenase [quinone] large subunit